MLEEAEAGKVPGPNEIKVTAPFLVTGCGRSGTGWAAALFTALGYPCGHEVQFSYDRTGPLTAPESSWLAVPHLDALPPRTPVLRIMRDPYAVVQSLMAKGFLLDGRDAYDVYVETHRPDITEGTRDHLGRVIRYVALWDEPLYEVDHHMLFAEDAATRAVEYATGDQPPGQVVRDVLALVGQKVNTHLDPWQVRPARERIDAHPDGALIAARAKMFGYTD